MLDGFPLYPVLRCRLTDRVNLSAGVEGGEDIGADLLDTSTVASFKDVCDGKEGGGGQSMVSSNSCGLMGDTGVGGPEDSL